MKAPPADFYEDDEDPEAVHAAFERAKKRATYARVGDTTTWTTGATVTITRTWPDTHTGTR
jgi:hypothetical protein